MKPRIECSAVRRHFWMSYITLAFFGELLLYICFAAPFLVDERFAIVSLQMPEQAKLFGTVWPYYSFLHLSAFAVGCGLLLLGPRRAVILNFPFISYAAVNMCGIASLPFLVPASHVIYWDFALEAMRLFSVVLLAGTVLEAREFSPLVLVRGLLILLIIPLGLLVATNPAGFLSERQGRVNGPGLEVTSTGHVAAFALLLGVSLQLPAKYRIILIGLAATMLVLSGARIPFMLAVVMIAVQLWCTTANRVKRYALIATLTVLTTMVIIFTASSSVAGGRFGTLTGDSADIETEYAVGRGVAAVTAVKLLAAHPLGYIDSDWSVQEELVRLGFPSHTHSHYFQSYLRFGPLVLVFWGVFIWRVRKGSRLRSPYTSCLWFVLIGSALDYYGFVTKAMLIVFMLTELNESYLRRVSASQI